MLSKSQVRAILDKTEVFQEGHFSLPEGYHSTLFASSMRVLQQPEYATSLAATLGSGYRTSRPQVVLAGPGPGALLGLELARAMRARLVLATPENGKWTLAAGQAINAGEKVVLCEDIVTDRTDLSGRIALVEAAGGQVTGCAVMLDRTQAPWDYPFALESLLRPEAPMVSADSCLQCREKVPVSAIRTAVVW
jgi:orotate phosphoribosyltransferase